MNKILQRFIDVWKLDFLANFVAGKHNDQKTTIGFWFLFNAIIAIAIAFSITAFLYSAKNDLTNWISESVPDQARVSVRDGQLQTENISEPFFREIEAQNEHNKEYQGTYVIVLDTTSQAYDITSLDEYIGGMIILKDRIFVKDSNEVRQFLIADVPDFSLSKFQILNFIHEKFYFPFSVIIIIAVFVMMLIFYGLLRLIAALWWALLLFIMAKVFDVRLEYVVAYKAVLNFYLIPTFVAFLTGYVIGHIPLFVTVIFIVIFIANLMWMKKNSVKNQVEHISQKDEQKTVIETIK